MVNCELCGKDVNSTIRVIVAGSEMSVCINCKSSGIVVDKSYVEKSHTFRRRIKSESESFNVISNYISVVNSTLAKKGLNFHQLAKGTNIKESSLTKYLSGKIKLDVETAIRIGRFLDISLLESSSSIDESSFMEDEVELVAPASLGDLIKRQLAGKK